MQASLPAPRSADRRVLLIAVGLGALAAVLMIAYLRGVDARTQVSQQIIPTRPVVVAKAAIPAGQRIALTMVEVKAVPEAGVAADAATAVEQVIGQTTRYPVSAGEQISKSRLVNAANGTALSFAVPKGMRAFTIPINAGRSPAALLVPGDFVDVLAILSGEDLGLSAPVSSQTGDPRDNSGVVTALQNVQVLSVDQTYIADGAPYDTSTRGAPTSKGVGSITLAVSPEEAQFMALLLDRAKYFTVSLRGFEDADTKELRPSTGPIQVSPDRPTLPSSLGGGQ